MAFFRIDFLKSAAVMAAWEFITDVFVNHLLSFNPSFKPSVSVNQTVTYRITGENREYLGSQKYSFGNELHMSPGVSDQDLFGNTLLSYGLNIRYRHAAKDVINEHPLPNTGGHWVFLMPTFSWHVSSRTALTVNFEVPSYSNIQGTQLTPTFRINAGVYFKFEPDRNLEFSL